MSLGIASASCLPPPSHAGACLASQLANDTVIQNDIGDTKCNTTRRVFDRFAHLKAISLADRQRQTWKSGVAFDLEHQPVFIFSDRR
jgi:hypothetical protein